VKPDSLQFNAFYKLFLLSVSRFHHWSRLSVTRIPSRCSFDFIHKKKKGGIKFTLSRYLYLEIAEYTQNVFFYLLLGHGIIHCYFHEVQYCTYIVKITFKINIIIVNNISQLCIHVFLEERLCMVIMSKWLWPSHW